MSTFNAGYEAGYGAAAQKALELARAFGDGDIDLSGLLWELENLGKKDAEVDHAAD